MHQGGCRVADNFFRQGEKGPTRPEVPLGLPVVSLCTEKVRNPQVINRINSQLWICSPWNNFRKAVSFHRFGNFFYFVEHYDPGTVYSVIARAGISGTGDPNNLPAGTPTAGFFIGRYHRQAGQH